MYLKQIELENFKSFGGKLTIPLLEGYLAVTGPNGSGKSNISDAILFVLGPKSSKAIRAGKLTDLIFDGGKTKERASYTKVSLVFDNADRMLPWDADTVRLTRLVRMAADGENYNSYFYVNDQKSSMTEFDSLLTRARISAEGYNLVQQGDVTRIVQMGNIERRRILDGISGIASYDADLQRALAEKAEAEVNLDRIGIIIVELDKQIEQLRKDTEAAKKYLEAQKALDIAKAQSVYRSLETARTNLAYTQEQIVNQNGEKTRLETRKQELVGIVESLTNKLKDKEAEIAAKVGPEYTELKINLQNVRVALATMRDRIDRNNDDMEEYRSDLSQLAEDRAENEAAIKDCDAQIAALKIERSAKQADLDVANAENDALKAKVSGWGGEHKELQEKLASVESEIEGKTGEENATRVALATAIAAEDEASKSLANLEAQIQGATFEIKDAEWNISQIKQELGPVADVSSIEKRASEARAEMSELEKQRSELYDTLSRLSNEYNKLSAEKSVTERMSKGSEAVSAVLEMRDKGVLQGIRGTVMELATVSPEYETALSIAAGGKMQAIIVDNDQVAADAMALLKRGSLGRATFLPLNKMVEGRPRAKAIMALKESLGYAIDLIDFAEEYRAAYWYVFADTLVVENLDIGRRLMGGIRIVTKNGELLEASGAMVGGSLGRQQALKFGAASQSKLDAVSAELRAANTSMDSLKGLLSAAKGKILALDEELRAANAGNAEAQAKLGKFEAQLKQLRETRKQLNDGMDEKRKKLDESAATKAKADSDLQAIVAELEGLKESRTKIRARISEIAPESISIRMEELRTAIFDLSNGVMSDNTDIGVKESEKSGYEAQRNVLDAQKSSYEGKITKCEESIAKDKASVAEKDIELKALQSIEARMESSISGLRDEKDEIVRNKFEAEGDAKSVKEKIDTTRGIISSLEAQAAIATATIDQLNEEVSALTVEVQQPIPSEDEIRRTIRSCETVISRIGQVNLRAIDDYEEKKARFDSLNDDVTRLNGQITDLNSLAAKLNGEKKGLFMKTYDGVNANFKEVYAELSGGGEAYMFLDDEEDPFQGGLQINAKPKNGKLLRLESLSGGEKSLTALAFIFAIQEFQPSPFYVLDEVDMFLDSINAEMVAMRVKKSSQRAQFIQVSLRKVTLSLADHLLGVTRQPNGISKVIIQPDLAEVSKYESESLKKQEAE